MIASRYIQLVFIFCRFPAANAHFCLLIIKRVSVLRRHTSLMFDMKWQGANHCGEVLFSRGGIGRTRRRFPPCARERGGGAFIALTFPRPFVPFCFSYPSHCGSASHTNSYLETRLLFLKTSESMALATLLRLNYGCKSALPRSCTQALYDESPLKCNTWVFYLFIFLFFCFWVSVS